MYKSRKQLKALARTQMQGRYKTLVGAIILEGVISLFLSYTITSFFPGNDLFSNIFYIIATLAVHAFLGTIAAGMTFISMAVACGMHCRVGEVYRAFQANPGKAVWIQLPIAVIYMICTLPATLMSMVTPLESYLTHLGVILILNGIGTIIASLISLPFALAFYMYWDFPEYDAKYILKHSAEIMRGNYLRYFALQLSFLPLQFLTVLSFGLGSLWVNPYISVTNANFYLDLMAKRNNE